MTSGLTNANDNYYGGNYSSYYTNQNENGNSYYSNSNDNINPYYNRNHNLDYNSNNNLNNNSNNNSNSNSNSNSNNNSNTNLNGYYSNYSQNEKQTSSQNQVPSQRGTYSSNSYNAYPNDHGTQQNYQTYQSSYQQSSYQQDAYEQGTDADGAGKKGKHGKKVKKSNPMLRKFVACLALGIVFGGFAGVSFIAVKGIDNYINGEPNSANESVLEGVDFGTTEEEASSLLKTSNNITAVVTDVTNVVDNVMPSVVSITNMYTETGSFFGRTFEENVEASGSGIIVGENDSELLVVTNYHVVADNKELKVQFIDGELATAQVKGTDSDMDLAVIAIPLDSLQATTREQITIARLGDSDSLKVGEPAIAIGNALGYGQSVTTGVISALNREVEMQSLSNTSETTINTLIQTDAAINPGNSGGALLNVNGEVIGINSNKIGGTAIEGMGYAIPISQAIPIMEELMIKETRMMVSEDKKGYLGISGVDVTAEVSEVYGMPEGIFVAQVHDGTGAAKSGLVKGDIITTFDGTKVDSMVELTSLLAYYEAGTTVEVTIMKGSPAGYEVSTLQITLGGKFN